ncbi:hypothetical protein WR25_16977 [Diploscapter pachys]|uniref:MADF domain-containing protein n=1 Tax=Diploscapter pachys TaxID=2018661 RepID=A0A2A2JKE2_9BILA|nr:hypothetical protein WR25_16977 [Diploscapter pachys]
MGLAGAGCGRKVGQGRRGRPEERKAKECEGERARPEPVNQSGTQPSQPIPYSMTSSLQPAFNARLIQEVKKHPELYNHTRRGSADTAERMRLWDKIAVTIDPTSTQNPEPGKFAKQRWLQLRDRYRKELKAAIRSNFATPIKWTYFSQLSWLDPYLKDNLGLAAGSMNSSFNGLHGFDASLGHFSLDALQALSGELTPKLEIDDFCSTADDTEMGGEMNSTLQTLFAIMNNHTRNSLSPNLENDVSAPQSVESSNGDVNEIVKSEDLDQAAIELTGTSGTGIQNPEQQPSMLQSKEERPILMEQEPQMGTGQMGSIYNHMKEQMRIRQAQQNMLRANLLQTNRLATDWINDEDLLYSRIIGLRLRKMDQKKKKRVISQIFSLLEESDEGETTEDSASSKSSNVTEGTEDLNTTSSS